MDETFHFSSESDNGSESMKNAIQSEGSVSNEKSEESNTNFRIPDIQVKVEDPEINEYSPDLLQSRCRAAALASFEAFNERNHILGGSQCSMELLSADATEKILTFEETLQLTDDHLYALWKKIDAGIPKLSKALGTHNRLVQKTRNIQKYQKDELEKLQVKFH